MVNMKEVIEFIPRIQDGGAEVLIKDYALLLDKNIFHVTIVCLDVKEESAVYKTLKDNNVRIIKLYNSFESIHKVSTRLIGKKHISKLFNNVLDELKPDIIHTHLELLEVLYHSRDHLNNVKLVYTCHNLPKTMVGSDLPKDNKAANYLIKNNNLQIIALHDEMKEEIDKLLNTNSIIINNGIDFNNYLEIKETKQEIRKSLGINEDSYVIGHIGRFTYQKNHNKIIDIFNEVTKLNDKAVLLLIGTGNLLNEIKNKTKEFEIYDKVIFLSNRNDVPRLLKSMDVFLFPSNYEGLSISLIEAQVSKLPCVVSDKINNKSYLTNNITELKLNDNNKKWANACLKPINNVNKTGDINDFNIRNSIKELEKLYLS